MNQALEDKNLRGISKGVQRVKTLTKCFASLALKGKSIYKGYFCSDQVKEDQLGILIFTSNNKNKGKNVSEMGVKFLLRILLIGELKCGIEIEKNKDKVISCKARKSKEK